MSGRSSSSGRTGTTRRSSSSAPVRSGWPTRRAGVHHRQRAGQSRADRTDLGVGSAPKAVGQPQNIFEAVFSSTCTSSRSPGRRLLGSALLEVEPRCHRHLQLEVASVTRASTGPIPCATLGERRLQAAPPGTPDRRPWRGHHLEADRQAVLGAKPQGTTARIAGQVRRDRAQVIQVHGQRVVDLLADPERHCRGGRRHSASNRSKARSKSCWIRVRTFCAFRSTRRNSPSSARRYQHDPALHLGAEPRPRLVVAIPHRLRAEGAEPYFTPS